MKKTIWRPLVLGVGLGVLAGISIAAGLSFLALGITNIAIGFYMILLLLAAASGGPLAGAIASILLVIISALFGGPDAKAILNDPASFWSNVIALVITMALVSFAYRLTFERLKSPIRLLAWAGIVLAGYALLVPASTTPQYVLNGDPVSEILPAILYGYQTYLPQVVFDIIITCLVFIALPAAYARPLWYEPNIASKRDGRTDKERDRFEAAKSETDGTRVHHEN